ncbi:MAG: YbdK family carboxylate-amine ligase [Planctomycetales bacterium]|nr:YbdK family carboxylate-amine ligase [Planctomycetales bacterium]
MGKITFSSNAYPSIGVELELGLCHVETGALSSSVQEVLGKLPPKMLDHVKPELMQCYVEINTGVCKNVGEVEADLRSSVSKVESVCDDLGLKLWWGATHPTCHWQEQKVSPSQRYEDLVQLLQDMARRLITFGLHVHIGVDSGDKAVMICDRIMQHLPTLLAISCSSPFWERRDTGLESYRSKIMEGLPTAGLPTLMRNWSEYVWLINHLVDTGFINTIREIWWDVRPHHGFGTVEVRVCDMPSSLDEVLALTALIQSLVQYLSNEIDEGTYQHDCHPMMVRQNKWRACRFGRHANLVNSYTYKVNSVADEVERLVSILGDTATDLACKDYLLTLPEIVKQPGGSERQRALLEQHDGVLAAVVNEMTRESRLSPA